MKLRKSQGTFLSYRKLVILWVLSGKYEKHKKNCKEWSLFWQDKYFQWQTPYYRYIGKEELNPVKENITHMPNTECLVIRGTFPVTWWYIPMSQEKLHVKERIPPVTKGVWLSVTEGFFPVKERIYLVTGNLFPVTGIKSRHGCMAEWNLKRLPKS